jgi:Histidine kinase-, DNA gyrase B-, and HSP90-like ATPase
VRIKIRVSGNRVRLIVDDSGSGIAPEERTKLFDRFHRATDKGNGAGLGLAIADSVVKAIGGEWWVGQADLGGAHMEVSWRRSPAAKGPEDGIEAPKASALERTPKETRSVVELLKAEAARSVIHGDRCVSPQGRPANRRPAWSAELIRLVALGALLTLSVSFEVAY